MQLPKYNNNKTGSLIASCVHHNILCKKYVRLNKNGQVVAKYSLKGIRDIVTNS